MVDVFAEVLFFVLSSRRRSRAAESKTRRNNMDKFRIQDRILIGGRVCCLLYNYVHQSVAFCYAAGGTELQRFAFFFSPTAV